MKQQEMLDILKEKVCECKKCPNLAETRTQTVFGEGNPNADICFLGEAPGQNEDKEGKPFVGRAGLLLNNILSACGIERKDVYILNILKCRPPQNRTPTEEESNNCKPYLDLQLKIIRPKFIVCLGATAAQNLLKTDIPISLLRKQWFQYDSPPVHAKVLAVYHPAYLLRNPAAKQDFWEDMQLLLAEMAACNSVSA